MTTSSSCAGTWFKSPSGWGGWGGIQFEPCSRPGEHRNTTSIARVPTRAPIPVPTIHRTLKSGRSCGNGKPVFFPLPGTGSPSYNHAGPGGLLTTHPTQTKREWRLGIGFGSEAGAEPKEDGSGTLTAIFTRAPHRRHPAPLHPTVHGAPRAVCVSVVHSASLRYAHCPQSLSSDVAEACSNPSNSHITPSVAPLNPPPRLCCFLPFPPSLQIGVASRARVEPL